MSAVLLMVAATAMAQRTTDTLDRGIVAVPSGSGYLVSWRKFGEEYYDTKYNLYRGGTLIAENLTASNYLDTGGKSTSSYTVAAVIRGVEQEQSAAVTPWVYGYLDIPVEAPLGRGGSEQWDYYTLNDVSLGDVDGDGRAEMLVKRVCSIASDTSNDSLFHHYDCYDWEGNQLWWMDLGPNMISGADEQFDCVLYDWDGDGKAEVLMRGVDNMIIHTADGQTITIGSSTTDTRYDGMSYTYYGNEYLLYIEGATGIPYEIGSESTPYYITYPIARGSDSDWGSGTIGHRSTKHFFGAPFLDGRNPSIFLARGIYTKTEMRAYDVDPTTHALTQRWSWSSGSSGSWYGQGYHNYAIADVDMDGRDEIVYGSMVIDDNGKGLSTTGLGHGDAQHCGDLDPYRWGLEQFACNEEQPNMNYRNATTSELYYRSVGTSDDGRALCGNFTNSYPGCVGRSVNTDMISCVADKEISVISGLLPWGYLNGRIYWTGDLLEEVFSSPGTEREAAIWATADDTWSRIFTSSGCKMSNWTKNNPAADADIIGDWREELVVRTSDNDYLRIYPTTYETEYGIYTLWHDHQYRQGMVWQCLGYNQPPHTSFFLGEMEGITQAPPPLTMTGRVEIANGGTISTANADEHILVCETNDTEINVSEGANPYIATFNVPSWVQGSGSNSGISYTYYTCNVTGSAFTGDMRLVKQGEGILVLPDVTQEYTGNTDVWGGTLSFNGSLPNSALWLNRHTALTSNGGSFRSIKADYNASIYVGGQETIGTLSVDSLYLGFGSRLVLDISGDLSADQLTAGYVSIETKDWDYGPTYLTPVVEFVNSADSLVVGTYNLGTIGTLDGDLSDLVVEGLGSSKKATLSIDDSGNLTLTVLDVRANTTIVWNGNESSTWNFGSAQNFTLESDATVTDEIFVTDDVVKFDDSATTFEVTLVGDLEPDSVIFNNTTAYTLSGSGSIAGSAVLVKEGSGNLTINTDNTYTGGTVLSGGTTYVSVLSNSTTTAGGLGAVNSSAAKFTMQNGAVLRPSGSVTMGSPMKMVDDDGGVIYNNYTFTCEKAITGTLLTKKGSGGLVLNTACSSLTQLTIAAGSVTVQGHSNPAKTVEFQGGSLYESSETTSSFSINVPSGKSGYWSLVQRGTYSNTITGAGTLTIYVPQLSSYDWTTRLPIQCDWSDFTGTIKATTAGSTVPFALNTSNSLANATLDIADDVTVQNSSGKSVTIGKVTGDSGILGGVCVFSQTTASGTCTWKLGNDENWSWGGYLTSSCNFAKVGSGKLTLKTSCDYTGTTTISEGELHINKGVLLGSGKLTVASGAILSGVTDDDDDMTNSSFAINGTLQIGVSATSATGMFNCNGKSVTFGSASELQVCARKCATASSNGCGSLGNVGTLTFNGTLNVSLSSSASFAEGDSIIVWSATSFSGTPTLASYIVDEEAGLYWDDSDLSEGILRVTTTVPTAIASISADGTFPAANVYSVGGQLLRTRATSLEGLPQGVYIVAGKKVYVK